MDYTTETVPTLYVSGANVPGYTPESDPWRFTEGADAFESFLDDVTNHVMMGDDEYRVGLPTGTVMVNDSTYPECMTTIRKLATDYWESTDHKRCDAWVFETGRDHDLGLHYWVESQPIDGDDLRNWNMANMRYAWPGGYEVFAVTDDGGVLCAQCVLDNWDEVVLSDASDGWHIDGWDNVSNHDEPPSCDHCSRQL